MENLVKHTTRLIAQHNCVIIPGLGAFLAQRVSASYNAEERIFVPPHRTLGFNAQITVDDTLLLSEYINEMHLSYEDAEKKMHSDISELRHTLSAKGCVRMGELGTFNMNVKGEISFIPDPNGIDDPYNFGLEPLLMPLLADCEKKEIVIKRHTFRKFVSIAAAIIVFFFLVAPIGNSLFNSSMHAGIPSGKKSVTAPHQETTVVEVKSNAIEPTCTISPIEETVTKNIYTEDYIEQIAEPEIQTIVAAKTTEENGPKFSIIVASSPNEANAQLAITEMNAKMQASYSVVKGNGRYRIAHSTYSSNTDAAAMLSQIKGIFPDAWVLTH